MGKAWEIKEKQEKTKQFREGQGKYRKGPEAIKERKRGEREN